MARKKLGSKKQFNINELLYFLIFISLLGIFYMLYEEKINSFFSQKNQKEQIVQEKPKVYDNVNDEYDKSWYLNSISQYKNYSLKFIYLLNITSPIEQVVAKIPLPQNQKNWQYIFENNFSAQDYSIIQEDGNKFIKYELHNPEIQPYKFQLITQVAVRPYDINTAKKINRNLRPEINIEKYLQAEKNIEIDSYSIKQVANLIQGNTKEEIVRNIYAFIQENIEYTANEQTVSAEDVLKIKKALCGGFSNLMVALCRIKNIPARVVYGNIIKDGRDSKHNWVEVYFSEYGWVLYDPVFFVRDKNHKIKSQKEEIRTPLYDYIILGYNRNEAWSVEMTSQNEIKTPITIDDSFFIEKS